MADDNKDSSVSDKASEKPMETNVEESIAATSAVPQDVEMHEASSGDTVTETETAPPPPAQTAKRKATGLCYCARGRSVGEVELQCSICLKWFHKECITTNVGNMLPFMTTYHFCCKYCHPNNQEVYSRRMPNFSQLCHMALANLMSQHKPKTMFSKEKELIPFIDGNWESLTPMQRRTTVTWHATIVKAMLKDNELFVHKEKPDNSSDDESDYPMFGLVDKDLSSISPNYDPSKPSNTQGSTNTQPLTSSNDIEKSWKSKQKGSRFLGSDMITDPSSSGNTAPPTRGKRGPKKRENVENAIGVSSNKKLKGDTIVTPKLPAHGFPLEHPFNKDGYRYVLTETDPQVQSAAYDDDFWIGKPIPAHLYRAVVGTEVLLAPQDRAPTLKIADNRLTVTGKEGYCMVRATHGTNRGAWYFEVRMDSLPEGTATRLGWSQPLGNLQAPLGYDKFSYSWRSRKGTRFHQSRGKHYSDAYKQGDVLGFYIKLPKPNDIDPHKFLPETYKDSPAIGLKLRLPNDIDPHKFLPETYKDSTLIKFKSHLYFEEKDEAAEVEKSLKPKEKTQIIFYRNGKSQGVAFEDIFEGTYFPAMSLFKSCTVTANFGPVFKYPPKDIKDWEPICRLAEQAQVEQTLSDIIYHVEHEDEYRNYERGVYI